MSRKQIRNNLNKQNIKFSKYRNRKISVTVGKEIKIFLHDAIVYTGKITKDNHSQIQSLIAISDNYIIK